MSHPDAPRSNAVPPVTTARTWIAVFDGGRGAVFRNAGFDDAPSFELVFSVENQNKATHELGRGKPGRINIPGGGQAGLEATDLHDRREAAFMDAFCDRVEQLAIAGSFDRLVLLAPSEGIRRFRHRAQSAFAKLAGLRHGDYAHSRTERIEVAFKEAVTRPSW